MSPKNEAAPTTFESALHELQGVVAQLEDGSLALEDAVQLLERGSQLARVCKGIVDAAELRITRLAGESATPLSDVDVPADR